MWAKTAVQRHTLYSAVGTNTADKRHTLSNRQAWPTKNTTGLDVDKDVGFDKYSVRHQINGLIVQLWDTPLPEPRESLRALATKPGASPLVPGPAAGQGHGEALFEFFKSALDTIAYTLEDACDRPVGTP